MDEHRAPRKAWLIFALAIAAYAAAVFQRSSLGVGEVAAQHRFGTTAAVLSLFSVLQLAVYAGMQIPVGAILDRVGSRRLIATGATVMGAGQLLLATAHTIPLAVLARVLVGGGDAMTFISVLRLILMWFPSRQVPMLFQVAAILGLIGQLAAAYPLVALLQGVGWSTAFAIAAAVGFTVAITSAVGLRNAPAGAVLHPVPAGVGELATRLGHAWREPGTRLGMWTHFVTQFSGTVFALLWGYPFLVVGERLSKTQAGLLLTLLVAVAMIVAPTLGHITARWPYRRSVSVIAITTATASIWTVVLAWPGRAPLPVLIALVVVLASNGPGSMMGFDYARTENEPERVGSASGIVNVGGFTASLLTIALIGLLLSLQSSGGPTSYTLGDFKVAFSVQYVFWATGLVGVLRTRRRLRAARGLDIDPLHRAIVRRWRGRGAAR
ncbi:MAG TPA: MFS transporter [Solirubrobacteraceae bacterium]|nr:MFS transporter [Solirubrobacteraceae bacterium]